MPAVAFAQQKDLKYIIGLVVVYFNYAVYLIMGLAIVMFTWNVFKYFIKGGDDVGAKKEAGQYVLWSVVGFFVILSFWGIVNILTNTFKLDSSQPSGFFGSFQSSFTGSNVFGGSNSITPGTNTGASNSITPGTNTGGAITTPKTESKGILRTLWGIVY